jgi:hypothetical protein
MNRESILSARPASPTPSGALLQRKCDCGKHTMGGGPCSGCRGSSTSVPPIVDEILRSPGQPLDAATRSFMEPRFKRDFSHVRIHSEPRASQSAESVDALAYTVGADIVTGPGHLTAAPHERYRLLAHELTHVVQQSNSSSMSAGLRLADDRGAEEAAEHNALSIRAQDVRDSSIAPGLIQRAPKTLGSKVTHPAGSKSSYKKISASFDGQDFEVTGDATQLMSVPAGSGRPITVRPADVKRCKGAPGDSYFNNPRYVGIADNGPIPEGTYKFALTSMMTFSTSEQYEMVLGGDFLDPFGSNLHGGDWGAGRVALTPVTISPSTFCGSTGSRSGFFLHGGVLPGSSGCIDIGNSAFQNLIPLLEGYRVPVSVSVKYLHPAPSVSTATRALGRFTYPDTPSKNPSLLDRLESVFGGDPDE